MTERVRRWFRGLVAKRRRKRHMEWHLKTGVGFCARCYADVSIVIDLSPYENPDGSRDIICPPKRSQFVPDTDWRDLVYEEGN